VACGAITEARGSSVFGSSPISLGSMSFEWGPFFSFLSRCRCCPGGFAGDLRGMMEDLVLMQDRLGA
jgi:hypothetical protein